MQAGDRVRTDLVVGEEELEVATVDERRVTLAAEQGAWVCAVRAGAVTAAEIAPGDVIVQGDDGNTYFYGHLESTNVHVGQRVTTGRPLGQVGLDPGQRAEVEFGVYNGDPPHPIDPAPLLTFTNAPTDITDTLLGHMQVMPAPTPATDRAPSTAMLPRTMDDAAQLLRDQGWKVEPPSPPGATGTEPA